MCIIVETRLLFELGAMIDYLIDPTLEEIGKLQGSNNLPNRWYAYKGGIILNFI